MRTTVTLDADTEQLLRRWMAEPKVSFKQALNDAIRAGLARSEEDRPWTKTFAMGPAKVDLTCIGRLLDEMDVAEYLREEAAARRDLGEA